MTVFQMKEVAKEYRRLRTVVPLGTLRTKKDYARAVEMLDALLDEIGEDEKHPMAELADAIGVFVEKYEAEHHAIDRAKMKPVELIRSLMEEHGMSESDLGRLLGDRSLGRRILSGEREPSKAHIRILAEHFSLKPSALLG